MNTSVFSSKLDRLSDTVNIVLGREHDYLVEALERAARKPIAAIGSGGSVVAAEFLSSCRSALMHAPTAVSTPMGFVLDPCLPTWGVWLFSASGENADVLAALREAATEHVDGIDIVTVRPSSRLAEQALRLRKPRIHVTPVAEEKDGFLATHSLVSAITSLLLATDEAAGSPPSSDRKVQIADIASRAFSVESRKLIADRLGRFSSPMIDTILVLHDPALASAAVMIETSCWEAGICAVQRTDFRNFAHGRHVWLKQHPYRTLVLALTFGRTRPFWESLDNDLPPDILRVDFDFGAVGRAGIYEGVLRSFGIVEALGGAKGIDPGKPGFGEFGRSMFERADLLQIVDGEDAASRRKRRAEIRSDLSDRDAASWSQHRDEYVELLGNTDIGAVVLDYDGTVVSTADRKKGPSAEMIDAIASLIDKGLVVAFATGRGGSIGEDLRPLLPPEICENILVGYYNGAHVVPLTVDLKKDPPEEDAVITRVFGQLTKAKSLLRRGRSLKQSALQITIPFEDLASREEGGRRLRAIVADEPEARILRSGHSFDICPAWVGKCRVIDEVRKLMVTPSAAVLTIGDSGDCQGNDFELLEGHFGLSVDRVCHRHSSCWNLLPGGVSGPEGLLRILSSLRGTGQRLVRLNVSALMSDR